MQRPAAILLFTLVSPAMAQVEATVSLTHDDADGVILVGESMTWTLTASFVGGTASAWIASSNMAILGDNALGTSTDFVYNPFGDGLGFNGGYNDGDSNGAGIAFVSFTNWDDLFQGPKRLDNPLTIGTFGFTAGQAGTLEYEFAKGVGPGAFLDVWLTAFVAESFANPEDVSFEIDTLTIVPTPGAGVVLGVAGLVGIRRRR